MQGEILTIPKLFRSSLCLALRKQEKTMKKQCPMPICSLPIGLHAFGMFMFDEETSVSQINY